MKERRGGGSRVQREDQEDNAAGWLVRVNEMWPVIPFLDCYVQTEKRGKSIKGGESNEKGGGVSRMGTFNTRFILMLARMILAGKKRRKQKAFCCSHIMLLKTALK